MQNPSLKKKCNETENVQRRNFFFILNIIGIPGHRTRLKDFVLLLSEFLLIYRICGTLMLLNLTHIILIHSSVKKCFQILCFIPETYISMQN